MRSIVRSRSTNSRCWVCRIKPSGERPFCSAPPLHGLSRPRCCSWTSHTRPPALPPELSRSGDPPHRFGDVREKTHGSCFLRAVRDLHCSVTFPLISYCADSLLDHVVVTRESVIRQAESAVSPLRNVLCQTISPSLSLASHKASHVLTFFGGNC